MDSNNLANKSETYVAIYGMMSTPPYFFAKFVS